MNLRTSRPGFSYVKKVIKIEPTKDANEHYPIYRKFYSRNKTDDRLLHKSFL